MSSKLPQPASGTHPGIHIRQIIEDRGMSQSDLAFILGCPINGLNLILSGKRGVSAEMSKALGQALGLSPDYFADLQKSYDIARADEPNQGIPLRAKMQEKYPVREMIKRGWLSNSNNASPLETQLANFFEVENSNEVPYLVHAAKKSSYEEREVPPVQLAWLFRVKQIAKSISVPSYSSETLKKALGSMREMRIAPEETRHVPRLMSECGVRFIMVEPLPKSKIDGVAFWLDKFSPVIGLSSRLDRIDNFWFVLRHEIEHILNGHGQDVAMIDSDLEQARTSNDRPETEQIADKAAAEFCVPSEKIESFIRRKHPFYYEKDMVAFSKLNGIHPGLAVGQIQFLTKRYDYLRKYLVKVRQFVLPGSMADGWGQTVPITNNGGTIRD